MEKSYVLATLFRVSEQLRIERAQHRHQSQTAGTPEEKAYAAQIDALAPSGRNLLCLLKNTENANQRTLAKQMEVSAQAVSEVVKKLEQGGYITKVCGAQNNENIISLTAQGAVLAEKLDQRIKNHAEIVFQSLSEAELETLQTLLSKITSEQA